MRIGLYVVIVLLIFIAGCGGSGSGGSGPVTDGITVRPIEEPNRPAYQSTPTGLDYTSALWHVGFDSLPTGKLSTTDLCKNGLQGYCYSGNVDVDRDIDMHSAYAEYESVLFLGSTALKVTVDPEKLTSNIAMRFIRDHRSLADYDELYYSYRVYYPEDFDAGRGFKAIGGLLGLVPNMPHPSGCNPTAPDSGFSVRSMVLPQNTGEFAGKYMVTYAYIYHQNRPDSKPCGDEIPYSGYWEYRKGLPQGYLVETRVKMNQPGLKNGIVETTINGELVQKLDSMVFSQSGGYGINHSQFVMFYGGDYTWNPKRRTYVIIDDLAVTLKSVYRK